MNFHEASVYKRDVEVLQHADGFTQYLRPRSEQRALTSLAWMQSLRRVGDVERTGMQT